MSRGRPHDSLLIAQIVLTLFVFVMLLNSAAVMVYVERKVAALLQQRLGPYLVGPKGLLQPLADVIKLMFKEELRPTRGRSRSSSRWRRSFPRPPPSPRSPSCRSAPTTTLFGLLDEPLRLQVADVNVAVLVDLRDRVDERLRHRARRLELEQQVLAARRAALVGADDQLRAVLRPGAGERAAARQLAVAAPTSSIGQAGTWLGFIPRWFVFLQPLGFLIYMTAGIAETNRAPFDFPEAEQELVAGYHTEYSSMSFAMFFLAEYINMVTVSAVATDLFLGGWHGPFLPESLGWIWFLLKVAAILFFYVWMRWTLPRYRYDQLMAFGWKVLLPVAVLNLLVTAAGVLYFGL